MHCPRSAYGGIARFGCVYSKQRAALAIPTNTTLKGLKQPAVDLAVGSASIECSWWGVGATPRKSWRANQFVKTTFSASFSPAAAKTS